MTRTQHLNDEALISIAQDNGPGAGASSHVDSCPLCAHELEAWRRISDLARVSVNVVPPAKEDLLQRVFGELDSPLRRSAAPSRSRRVLTSRGWSSGGRWVIAVPIAIAALVLALTLGFGSSAPSDAMVLKTIRSSPSVAAMLSQTVHWTALEVDRAPQGFIDVEYRTHGAVDPRTNAFDLTTKAIIPGGDPNFGSSTTLSDGSLVYLPCDAQWTFIGKKPCLAYPAQSGTASGSPSLTFLRYASGPVARLGEREIDGVETNGYRVSVPVSALAQSAIPSERSLLQYQNSTISDVHVEVWSDQQGLPRQLDFTFLVHQATLSAVLRASEKEQLSYSTAPPKVSVPSRNTVTVASSLNAALLLQSQYRNALIVYFKQLSGHTETSGCYAVHVTGIPENPGRQSPDHG